MVSIYLRFTETCEIYDKNIGTYEGGRFLRGGITEAYDGPEIYKDTIRLFVRRYS
jgi:hypothetical protein